MQERAIDAAKAMAKRAYCPYSKFKVGAAVVTPNGNIYGGCNVENASYGLTNCAERTAIFNAVSNDEAQIDLVVIYTPTIRATAPCGACRQVIREFANPNTQILCVCDSHERFTFTVNGLMPNSFGPEFLG